ncbi:hypothetical protein C3B61_12815 [Cryobacterium zongtaii]|uniref:DUF3429 domain-containing protein n=1 Tax=Cryobacterium zongtaii TaxID=1259217 RepID=A0A2S3ZD92_9MICO|nr:hypothetical protein C3B61_12815 [Cryobacterium zongtaii]POH67870.1 hypothetical protein C3B60_06600 [Cryobacterium zongtaii]
MHSSTTNRRFPGGFVTEASVYGTILVSGMIVVAGGYGATSWQTFLGVIGTVFVFWAAHVYAGAVVEYGLNQAQDSTMATAVRLSLRHSLGFLTSAIPPSIVLLLGALRAVPDDVAVWAALWLGVVILGAIGYSAFAFRGSPWVIRILGCLGTSTLGIAMILLKVLVH